MGIFVPTSVCLLAFHTFSTELSIRLAGVALEALGVLIAVLGLIEIREMFDLPSIRFVIVDWVKGFPRWRHTTIISVDSASISMTAGKARLSTWWPFSEGDSIDETVSKLVKNVEKLRAEIASTHEELDKIERDNNDRIKNEREARESVAQAIRETMKQALIGGFHISLIGLLWVLLGLVLSNFSAELLRW